MFAAHYSAKQWTFAKGALCTFDRKFFGPIGKHVLHGICETHVAHHISSKIPHYAAWDATEAIKNYVGEYYHYTDENFLKSVWTNYRQCKVSRGVVGQIRPSRIADVPALLVVYRGHW